MGAAGPVRLGALVVCFVAAISRLWAVSSGGFYWDDFVLQGRSARLPLDADFLTYDHDGHLMPGAWAWAWALERWAPLDHTWVVATTVGLVVVVLVVCYALIVGVFGERPGALVPFSLLALSVGMLPSTLWWAASLNLLPMMAATAGAGAAYLRRIRSGRRRWSVVAVACFTIGLLFFEKTLLVLLLLPGLGLIVRSRQPLRRSAARVWRGSRALWVVLAAVTAAYLLVRVLTGTRRPELPPDLASVGDLTVIAVFRTLLPSLLGGPLEWSPVGFGSAVADPPAWLIAVSAVLVGALVVVGVRATRAGRRAWALAALWIVADLFLVAFGRLSGDIPVDFVASMRYTADAVLPLSLAVGCSLLPVPPSTISPLRRLRHVWDRRHPVLLGAAVAAMALWAIALSVSTLGLVRIWQAGPAIPWLENARASMAAADPTVPVLDQAVPQPVLYPLSFPYNQIWWTLAPLPDRPEIARWTPDLRVMDPLGVLVPGVVDGIASRPGPDGTCGTRLDAGSATLVLQRPAFEWQYAVTLGYLSPGDFPVDLRLGDGPPMSVPLRQGLHQVTALVEGGGDRLTVSGVPAGAVVCLGGAVVGVATTR